MADDGRERPGYRFDGFTLDPSRGALLARDGAEIGLRPKAFGLLSHLLGRAGHLVDRDELMEAIWPGIFVTDDSLAQCVKEVRRALGDDARRIIRTLPRRGYLLAVPVERLRMPEPAPDSDSRGPELPAPRAGRPMLVVMPFDDVGAGPQERYLARGLTTDLVVNLTRLQSLHVVCPLGRAPADPVAPSMGETAKDAAYLLEGSVRRDGGRIRVTARLLDARSGVSLWADRFDRKLDDVFLVQDELCLHLAALIDARIRQEELAQLRLRHPASFGAYDLFLQARDLHDRAREADTLTARRLFDRALRADPDYAPALAYQSYAVQRGFTLGWGEPRGRPALDLAHQLAWKAVSLDPSSSLCRMRLAFVLSLLGRDDEAIDAGIGGVHGNPCDAGGRAALGEILSRAGMHAAGAQELRLALSLDPYHPPTWRATLGRALLMAGDAEEALTELRRSAALAPDYRPCHSSIVVACIETGRLEEARAAMREVQRLRPGWGPSDYDQAYDGVFGFRRNEDTDRFLAAFRAAGMSLR